MVVIYKINIIIQIVDKRVFTPKVMDITAMIDTLIISQHVNSNPDTFISFSLQNMNENIFMKHN